MNLRIRGTIFRMSGFDLLSIRNLMETMGESVEQAMGGLKIPEEEKRKYLDELRERPILFTVEKEGLSSKNTLFFNAKIVYKIAYSCKI